VCHLIVEGVSDSVIVRSYCAGEALRVLIYYVPALDIDCVDPSGPGGNRARAIRISAHLGQIQARRLFCIIDRDGDEFSGFDWNSHCLVTDLSCVEIYPLDPEEFRTFVGRAFMFEFTDHMLTSILDVSRKMSVVLWLKERKLPGLSLANVVNSLHVAGDLVSLDVRGWLTRSLAAGGAATTWLSLEADLNILEGSFPTDHRVLMRVHDLDEVFRFWVHKTRGRQLPLGWVEQNLRGLAHHRALSAYDFFKAIRGRCEQEFAMN
jgi:hypothetical protein